LRGVVCSACRPPLLFTIAFKKAAREPKHWARPPETVALASHGQDLNSQILPIELSIYKARKQIFQLSGIRKLCTLNLKSHLYTYAAAVLISTVRTLFSKVMLASAVSRCPNVLLTVQNSIIIPPHLSTYLPTNALLLTRIDLE
jgi:hypothetical protein